MGRVFCGNIVARKLAKVSLSNNTIKRRIQELSEDVLQQTIVSVKRSGKFSLRLDETTDIGNDVQLMVFVRYHDTNNYMEQFLFCRPLAKNTTEEQIFKKVDSFFIYLFYFISMFILLTRRKATEALIHRVGNYSDLLPEIPRYCCPPGDMTVI